MCHGKPLVDWSDLPLVATRLLGVLLIASMLATFCRKGMPWMRIPDIPWLDTMLSVLDEEDILWQFVRIHTLVLPSLRSMERLITTFTLGDTESRIHFVIGAIVLIFVAGGIGNFVGSRVVGHRVAGMDAALGSALGYLTSRGNQQALFSVLGFRATCTALFWMDIVRLVLERKGGKTVAVVVGAALGHGFGGSHRQWLIERLTHKLLGHWGRFLESFQ
mmetsp:Transcript_16673/g.38311  ORF Transcript_16673/g.38311 Transcript_16673/m.38311 type:complete len:219 (+) Transcript_16673:375-1031(+)|eukprot:CAMPEP_0116842472 /NCGR_PEP_ID=MMETSP0418-20121206/11534_1 /TAXON_ID=1158023 /ORGANISM="Astrosyne radiata, Strain 13vi08-1A" /LENGTH=218 /DNA_ID=CAMNT_0004473083 /DNA_START=335 /DNA_END=991 /DNA_ORIENTATION=-